MEDEAPAKKKMCVWRDICFEDSLFKVIEERDKAALKEHLEQCTSIMCRSSLLLVHTGDDDKSCEEMMQLILEHSVDKTIKDSDNGRTPIMMAVKASHLSCIKLFLDKNFCVNAHCKKQNTALMLALKRRKECFQMCSMLLEAGAEVNVLNVHAMNPFKQLRNMSLKNQAPLANLFLQYSKQISIGYEDLWYVLFEEFISGSSPDETRLRDIQAIMGPSVDFKEYMNCEFFEALECALENILCRVPHSDIIKRLQEVYQILSENIEPSLKHNTEHLKMMFSSIYSNTHHDLLLCSLQAFAQSPFKDVIMEECRWKGNTVPFTSPHYWLATKDIKNCPVDLIVKVICNTLQVNDKLKNESWNLLTKTLEILHPEDGYFHMIADKTLPPLIVLALSKLDDDDNFMTLVKMLINKGAPVNNNFLISTSQHFSIPTAFYIAAFTGKLRMLKVLAQFWCEPPLCILKLLPNLTKDNTEKLKKLVVDIHDFSGPLPLSDAKPVLQNLEGALQELQGTKLANLIGGALSDLYEQVKQIHDSIPRLKELSRVAVRRNFKSGNNLPQQIYSLDIPETLHNYLCFR